jgi:hypothetical protein
MRVRVIVKASNESEAFGAVFTPELRKQEELMRIRVYTQR